MSQFQKPAFDTLSFCRSSTSGQFVVDEPAEANDPMVPGALLDNRYRLVDQIGKGGMGRVYLAHDQRLDRRVAIKVLSSDTQSEEALKRIQWEARLGAGLQHPGIATVYDFGCLAGQSFTVFEFVEGKTLRKLLEERGKLPLEETRLIINQLARALDYAHSKGVVHRDLKPENICLTPSGVFKILDLGLARDLNEETASGQYSGTPAYSSTEQACCQPTDGRSDQYSLGIICYELLTGVRPFLADAPAEMLLHQIRSPAPDPRVLCPELPETVAAAIGRALAKNPGERFATCQEFSLSVGQHEVGSSSGVISVASSDRRSFYICHAAEDSIIAASLARQLESAGHVCWFYQRNALPGVSIRQQTRLAIARCQGIVVIISRALMRNQSLRYELEHAHQLERVFFSLLLDMSQEEFDGQNPVWRSMLGPGALLPIVGREGIADAAERLVQGARSVGIHSRIEKVHASRDGVKTQLISRRWATDANQISIRDLDRVVYRTEVIQDFLASRTKFFLSATKGLGKTLLLTYKRDLLAKEPSRGRATMMIPEGRPYLDFMSELRSLSERFLQPLSDLNTAKRLWNASLRISVLSHHESVISEDEQFELEAFPRRIRRWLQGVKIEPTVVFKEFTNLPVSELNRVIDQTESFLDHKIRTIHSGTVLFVDKVDQAVRKLPRQSWINVQAGLIEAAWEMMNCNSHIRVFATIREEAFANYESDVKSNLFGATTRLAYTDRELAEMLDQLCQCYEGESGFRDFAGFNVVRHPQRPDPEDAYQFVRRHTFGRPRDLVAMASAMSAVRKSLSEDRFQKLVHDTAATSLVSNVFDEFQVFLSCLDDRENRERFLASIPRNVLSYQEAIKVSEEFNGLSPGSMRHFADDSEDVFHPFRDLYLSGLLGVIDTDPESGRPVQRFRQPQELIRDIGLRVPRSDVYLIHPALNTYISQHRCDRPYGVCSHVRIGHGEDWEPHDILFCEIEKQLGEYIGSELHALGYRLLGRIHAHLKSSHDRLQPFVPGPDWESLQSITPEPEDLIYWFEELLGEAQQHHR